MQIYVDYGGDNSRENPLLPYAAIQDLGNNAEKSLSCFFPGQFLRPQSDFVVYVKAGAAPEEDRSALLTYNDGAVTLYPETLTKLGFDPIHSLAHEAGHHVYANLMSSLKLNDLDLQHRIIKEGFAEMLANVLLSRGDEGALKHQYSGLSSNPYLKQPLFGTYRYRSYPSVSERTKDAYILHILSQTYGLRKVAQVMYEPRLPILQYYSEYGDIFTNITHLIIGWSYHRQFLRTLEEKGLDINNILN
jgi:hypothetical protein